MKGKFDIRVIAIFVLTIILVIMLVIYFRNANNNTISGLNSSINGGINIEEQNNEISTEVTNTNGQNNTNNATKITFSGQISSALTENISLHATYYLEESYIQENKEIKEGENILKYTNGQYLTAPYDCVILTSNLPEIEGQCTNEHYVQISSTQRLAVQVNVSEDYINEIEVGDTANITIPAYDNLEVTGYVTKISSTAQNGSFTAMIEFDNSDDIMIGMSATITINL